MYSCFLCNKTYVWSHDLKRHAKAKHVNQQQQQPCTVQQEQQQPCTVQQQQITERNWWLFESVTPFKPCSSFVISGATKSGKTWWLYRLLREKNGMFIPNPPKKILYCYGVYQPLFDEMKQSLQDITFHEGLPTLETITELTSDGGHHLVVLDDLMQQVVMSPSMELLFTQGCHHRNISIVFITQNLFVQGKYSRTIALNATYLILFKNVRDASQIVTLARQLYPKKTDVLLKAYEDSLNEHTRGYLIVDLAPDTPDHLRLRRRVFINEDPIIYKT